MIAERQIKNYPGDVAHHGTGKIAAGNVFVLAVLVLVLALVLLLLVLKDVHNSLNCFFLT